MNFTSLVLAVLTIILVGPFVVALLSSLLTALTISIPVIVGAVFLIAVIKAIV